MIVSCPSCSAKYKVADARIQGRGAKITCPKCSHKFVVYREAEAAQAVDSDDLTEPTDPNEAQPPDDLARRDFRRWGIVWRVRKNSGRSIEFYDLAKLTDLLAQGLVDPSNSVSFDGQKWTLLKDIPDLASFFLDVWLRAERGDLKAAPSRSADEDESDAPTTVISHGAHLSEEIRRIVQEVSSDPPAPARADAPAPPPATSGKAVPSEPAPATPVASPGGPQENPASTRTGLLVAAVIVAVIVLALIVLNGRP